jgi:uncharacterized protein
LRICYTAGTGKGTRTHKASKQAALPQHRYTAGIVTGGPQSTDFAIAYEIAEALGPDQETGPHNAKALQVMPMVGSGGIQNIVDLLTLPGADMAIAPAVLLNRVRDSGKFGDIQNKLVYIAHCFLKKCTSSPLRTFTAFTTLTERP